MKGKFVHFIQPPRLKFDFIRSKADEFRQRHVQPPEEWIHFHEDFLEDDLNWFEQHAYEFAGRLLVPRNALMNEIRDLRPKLNEFRNMAGDDEENLIMAVSRLICKKFHVSPEVISRRIRIEKAWPNK